jgi:DNA repair protein RecO (recombination protein O)
MFHKTKGILLRKTKLSSGGFILKFFTEEFGIKTYFGRVTKKEKNTFLPLSIANITAYDQPKKTIHTIKEHQPDPPLRSVYQDVFKSNVLLFLNEILNHVIQEEEKNEEKYHFIESEIITLENEKFDPNFHLVFLMKFTYLLGIAPNLDNEKLYFDMEEGELTNIIPIHPHFFDEKETQLFKAIYTNSVKFSNDNRKRTLQLLVTYYRFHTDMKELKSLPILETIFS